MLLQTWIFPSYKPKSNPDKTNPFTNSRNLNLATNNNTESHSSNDTNFSLSREEYQYLVNLLKPSRSESSNHNKQIDADSNNHVVSSINKLGNILTLLSIWILNSGASDHVCPHLYFFKTIFKIKLVYVCFPNGTTLLAHYWDAIQLSDHFILHNILFLPQFHLNLMYILQLTKQLNCQLTFSPNSSYIPDLFS